jgi:hypothetical protein
LTVNPAAWATGVVPSAPRITVHVVPATLVTAMISLARDGSLTWNWVGGAAELLAAGNDDDDDTVHVSVVPAAGLVAPPEATVVCGRLA